MSEENYEENEKKIYKGLENKYKEKQKIDEIYVLVSTFFYTFVKTGFDIILQLFFISLSIISKHKIKLM